MSLTDSMVVMRRRVEVTYQDPDAVRALVRDTLGDLASPLEQAIKPGQTVLVKPNMVLHAHPNGGDLDALITHGSVVRAVLELVAEALKGDGRIVVGDAPLQGTDFNQAARSSGVAAAVDEVRSTSGLDINLVDFRKVHAEKDPHGHVKAWKEVPGDPRGYVEYDLGRHSALAPIAADSPRFRVSKYRPEDTPLYHNEASHRYVIAKSIADADVILNLPKLKTHCKVGVTLGLKNFVGTVGLKQCLAHHRDGGEGEGGDEYPGVSRLKRLSVKLQQAINGNQHALVRNLLHLLLRVDYRLLKTLGSDWVFDGEWHGNDTCWRMVLDLVRIARYGTPEGVLAPEPVRPVLTLLDGIVAGEGNGPLIATPKPLGCLIGGWNPLAVDLVATTLMGFDVDRFPLLREAQELSHAPLLDASRGEIKISCNAESLTWDALQDSAERMSFAPPPGWATHLEQA